MSTKPCPACGNPRGYCKVGLAHACTHPSVLDSPFRQRWGTADAPLVSQNGQVVNEDYIEYWRARALAAEICSHR